MHGSIVVDPFHYSGLLAHAGEGEWTGSESFIAGIGHVVVGVDHFVSTVAVVLLALALGKKGLPATFAAFAAIAGLVVAINFESQIWIVETLIKLSLVGLLMTLIAVAVGGKTSQPLVVLSTIVAVIAGLSNGNALGVAAVEAHGGWTNASGALFGIGLVSVLTLATVSIARIAYRREELATEGPLQQAG